MWLRTAALVVVILMVSVLIGTAAYNSGQVDRAANVDVVTDSNALIGLEPGGSSLVYADGNGELSIDFSQLANADGINANSSYTIGDTANANTTFAFNVTNNYDSAKDLTFGYAFDSAPGGSAAVTITVYDSTNSQLAQATDSADATASAVNAGSTVYVTVKFDASGVDSTSDLSGTLTISA